MLLSWFVSLSFTFSNLIMFRGAVYFVLITAFTKLGKFYPLFLLFLLLFIPLHQFLFSSWDFNYTQLLTFWYYSWDYVLHFFQFFSSLFFRLCNFCGNNFKFTYSFLSHLNSITLIHRAHFYFSCYIVQFWNFQCFLVYTFYFSLEYLCLSIYFKKFAFTS